MCLFYVELVKYNVYWNSKLFFLPATVANILTAVS